MAQYNEADIVKLINDCDILILPDNSSIEEALASENRQLLSAQKPQETSQEIHEIPDDPPEEQSEADFERIFQQSKLNKNKVPVRNTWRFGVESIW